MDLERGQCKRPLGAPGNPGFQFCKAPVAQSQSYCDQCKALLYVPSRGISEPKDENEAGVKRQRLIQAIIAKKKAEAQLRVGL